MAANPPHRMESPKPHVGRSTLVLLPAGQQEQYKHEAVI